MKILVAGSIIELDLAPALTELSEEFGGGYNDLVKAALTFDVRGGEIIEAQLWAGDNRAITSLGYADGICDVPPCVPFDSYEVADIPNDGGFQDEQFQHIKTPVIVYGVLDKNSWSIDFE